MIEPFFVDVMRSCNSPISARRWDLGFLGTYSDDRQPVLDELLLEPARRRPGRGFVVAGPQFPDSIEWPENVCRITHLAPGRHRRFYASQRFTLNVTRADMVRAGWSPSVRLFEAAACGVPVVASRIGGIITKSLSLRPRAGNPPRRIAGTPSGMLNSIGLANIGVARFIEEKLPFLRTAGTTVIANIAASSVDANPSKRGPAPFPWISGP